MMREGRGEGPSPLRLGIVGCGWISDWHGRAAAQVGDVEIVACCDSRAEVAEAWRERHGAARAYDDYATMVRDQDLDAVLLATWPPHHLEQIRTCLELGVRAILCEKALAVGSDQALEIFTAAREAGALVVEGFMYRHHPVIQRVDDLLAAGAIGAIDVINASFDSMDLEEVDPDDPARNWRQRKDLHGGVPYDHLCYCVDAANHFAEALPREVMARSSTSERYGTVNRVHGLIEYENGRVAVVQASKRGNFDWELKLKGRTGQIVVPVAWTPDRLPPREAYEPGEATDVLLRRRVDLFQYETEALPVPAADPYRCQLERFAAAVRGTATPRPALAESVVNIHTINALLESGRTRTTVPVDLPDAVRAERVAAPA
jgi:predicted dehydrogenase